MSRLKIVGAAVTLVALYGGWLLLRDAPFFAVKTVTISGLDGASAATIRATLEDAARGMTTTHMRVGRLRAAVASFPVVKNLTAQTEFPSGLRITVVQERPVAALMADGQLLPVAADGRIVRDAANVADLPTVEVGVIPTGSAISDPLSVSALELLDIAPPVLRARVATVSSGARGVAAALRNGPVVYFGDTTRLHAKWAAAARVLADAAAQGADYVDVRVPERPAAQIADPLTSGAAPSAPGTAAGALVSSG